MEKNIYTHSQVVLRSLLKKVRLDAGLRQVDLAHKIGEPQSFVSKYESGERKLDFIELHNICQAIGISMHDFIDRYEEAVNES